jgi:hypothetical protein
MLLAVVARHLDDAERARTALTRSRASNTARRLLDGIPRKAAEAESPSLNMAEIEGLGRGEKA